MDTIATVVIATVTVVLMWMVVPMPMVVPVESSLMVGGRTGRGTAVQGIYATSAECALEDVIPVFFRALDVWSGCMIHRAANCRRRWTRWKRQCCHMMIVL